MANEENSDAIFKVYPQSPLSLRERARVREKIVDVYRFIIYYSK
jgi:hypothetical protein